MADEQTSWLDDILNSIKSGSWATGKVGDVVEGTLKTLAAPAQYANELAKEVLPMPGIVKTITGEEQPTDLGQLLRPLPDVVNKSFGGGLDFVEQQFGHDARKAIEDTLNAGAIMHTGGVYAPRVADVARQLGYSPALEIPRRALASETGTATGEVPAISMVKEAPKAPEVPPPTPLSTALKGYLDDSVTERDLGRGIIREESGKVRQQQAQDASSVMSELSSWYSRPRQESLDFMTAIEKGEIDKIPNVNDRALAYELSNGLLRRTNEVINLEKKDGVNYFQSLVSNYFPHLWKDPKAASSLFDRLISSHTASEGSMDFLHDRTVDSMAMGIGKDVNNPTLEPKTWNPVEATITKIHEMDRFLMAHRIKDRGIESGLFVDGKDGIPDGWGKINDAVFGGKSYYAPADVVKDFNRFFSPGLAGNPIYDAIRGANSTMTMAQLGMSGFHYIFSTENSMISDLALGVQQLSQGRPLDAAKSTAWASTILGSSIRDAYVGGRIWDQYLDPASQGKYRDTIAALRTANARPGLDPVYMNKALNTMKEAIRDGNWPKAIARTLPTALEWISKPLMEKYVPSIKLGAFHRMVSNVLEQARDGGWSEAMTKREVQRAWDSIDNRFGQLDYSNMFWHKGATDLALAGIRAPGWAIGNVRELGGGMLDLAQQTGRVMAGEKFDLGPRLAYSIALPIGAGYIGALINLAFTGQWPQGLKDYYYPRDGTKDANGNPNRLGPVNYIKDIVGMASHPLNSIFAKLAPPINTTIDILKNSDFHNTELRHPGDPLPYQAVDLAKAIAEQMTPFSLRNYKSRGGQINTEALGTLVQSLVGILPAPREMVRTPAENAVASFLPRHLSAGPRTKEEADQLDNKRQLESSFRRGQIGIGDLTKAASTGALTKNQVVDMVRNRNLPTIVRDIRILNADEALKVYEVANPQEKALIEPYVRKAVIRKIQTNPEDRSNWINKLMDINKPTPPSYDPGQY